MADVVGELHLPGCGMAGTAMALRALDALNLGILVTDGRARLIFSNAAADRLLESDRSALSIIRGNRIGAALQDTQKILHEIIERICTRPGGDESHHMLAGTTGDARPDLAVYISPVPSAGSAGDRAAMILLRVIERECDVEIEARRLFGLTRMEAKFASSVASGLSLAEAARRHNVGLATARSHMKGIFRKTGVCRQSQVAALMRGAQTPVRPPEAVGGTCRRHDATQAAAMI